jgi:hypothetical protein
MVSVKLAPLTAWQSVQWQAKRVSGMFVSALIVAGERRHLFAFA